MADAVNLATLTASGRMDPGVGIWEVWRVFNAEPVASLGVVDSIINAAQFGFDLRSFRFFGLWINATSASGTAAVSVTLIQSHNDVAAQYAALAVGGTVVSSLGETATIYTLTPSPMPRMRLRVTGVGANPADSVVTAHLYMAA